MNKFPSSWQEIEIIEALAPNANGKPFQQGWSPQCERVPAQVGTWGVLKTTAIQHGEFWPHENKALPDHLEPRPQIEVKAGDVVMTCAGPRNRCGVACLVEHTRPRLMLSGKMYRFRPQTEVLEPKYLSYLIQRHETQLEIDRMKTGINDSGLNLTHDRFAALRFPLAPLREQRRIIAKIEELFSELDKATESLTLAREQCKFFIQVNLEKAFQELEETRPLPELLAKPMTNGYSGKPVKNVTPWRVLSLSATTSGNFQGDHFKYLDEPGLESRDIWCDPGDILVQRGNTIEYVGVPAIYTGSSREFIFPDLMIRLRADQQQISPTYLCYALASARIRNELRKKAKGSAGTMPKISQKILSEIRVPYCDPKQQQRITRQIDEFNSRIQTVQSEIDEQALRIVALRQSILKTAFSGQLVLQDPTDEPAAALLARLREQELAPRTRRRKIA